MNERIDKLFEQALEEFKAENKYATIIVPDPLKEKFAELIVQECLKIVEPTEDSGDEWCVTLKGTAQEIKQHFGVEE
jgi:hypothetical protein